MRYLKLYGLRYARRILKGIDADTKLEIDYRFIPVTGKYEISIYNPYSGNRLFICFRLTKFDGITYIVRENFDKQSGILSFSSALKILDDNLVDELETFSLTL